MNYRLWPKGGESANTLLWRPVKRTLAGNLVGNLLIEERSSDGCHERLRKRLVGWTEKKARNDVRTRICLSEIEPALTAEMRPEVEGTYAACQLSRERIYIR